MVREETSATRSDGRMVGLICGVIAALVRNVAFARDEPNDLYLLTQCTLLFVRKLFYDDSTTTTATRTSTVVLSRTDRPDSLRMPVEFAIFRANDELGGGSSPAHSRRSSCLTQTLP